MSNFIKQAKQELTDDYHIIMKANNGEALDSATYDLDNIISRDRLDAERNKIDDEINHESTADLEKHIKKYHLDK